MTPIKATNSRRSLCLDYLFDIDLAAATHNMETVGGLYFA